MKKVKLDDIETGGGTQIRQKLCTDTVAEYADAYKSGVKLPPLLVCHDGKTYWLYDGFHRWHALRTAGETHAEVEVFKGTLRDARQLAAGANASHGLKRTNADKRAAVLVFLEDEEWVQWSDRKVAEAAAVSVNFVGDVRRQLSSDDSSTAAKASEKPRVGKDGKKRKPPKPKQEQKIYNDPFNAADLDAAPPQPQFAVHHDNSLIKDVHKATQAVSRKLAAAAEVHGEGRYYKAISDGIKSIKQACCEWGQFE